MEISARFGQDTVAFTLAERIQQQRRRLTEAERQAPGSSKQEWTQTREATGELVFKIKPFHASAMGANHRSSTLPRPPAI